MPQAGLEPATETAFEAAASTTFRHRGNEITMEVQWCGRRGSNPHSEEPVPETGASTKFRHVRVDGAVTRARTWRLDPTKIALYPMSYDSKPQGKLAG